MFLFAVSIFLSAFLLFQIQPLIGKFILPWFGGTSTVWSTVILFFQVLLTCGYAYAYWLVQRLGAKRQIILHTSLIAFAILLLMWGSLVWDSPVTPDSGWKPQNVDTPITDIFRLLIISVGLPYFILAANGPLMQAWFSRLFPERSYTGLYALSNLGSLLGLLSYPVLVEPALSLRWQGWLWALAFMLFGLIAIWIAFQSGRVTHPAAVAAHSESHLTRPSLSLMLLWMSLSATASLFLLSVTNQITQEVAVIPFLWVLPLALYLLSFVVTFSGKRGYHRRVFIALFLFSTALTLFAMLNATRLQIYWQVLAYCLLLFAACMLCHGELYLLQPSAEYLTTYYLMVSIGGALGGIFVNLIAPLIFNGYWEFFVGEALMIAIMLTVLRAAKSRFSSGDGSDAFRVTKSTPALVPGTAGHGAREHAPTSDPDLPSRTRFIITTFCLVTVLLAMLSRYVSTAVFSERNFYGIVRVQQQTPPHSAERAYMMSHGITVHGLQFIAPDLRALPTTYYVPNGGAGLAILHHPSYERGEPMHVGLLGAGVGTLVAYARPGDRYRLYEINPVVVGLAQGQGDYFSFLSDSQADISIVLGDARISLERERAEGNQQSFDVLVLDTFSSDSIPVHLVTKEAFALYLAHLAPHGLVAAHITNLHLDLQPVLWGLAKEYGLGFTRIDYAGDSNGGFASHWILLSRDSAVLKNPAIQEHAVDLRGYSTEVRLWTDDYSNLLQILK